MATQEEDPVDYTKPKPSEILAQIGGVPSLLLSLLFLALLRIVESQADPFMMEKMLMDNNVKDMLVADVMLLVKEITDSVIDDLVDKQQQFNDYYDYVEENLESDEVISANPFPNMFENIVSIRKILLDKMMDMLVDDSNYETLYIPGLSFTLAKKDIYWDNEVEFEIYIIYEFETTTILDYNDRRNDREARARATSYRTQEWYLGTYTMFLEG